MALPRLIRFAPRRIYGLPVRRGKSFPVLFLPGENLMLTGSCLCGGVRYEYRGQIDEISCCHCADCRKAQGSAFVAVSPIDARLFRLTAGAELLKEYRATPNKARVFCSRCGSPLYSVRDDLPDTLRLRLGTLDTALACRNMYHSFVDSKASWYAITDNLPRYPGFKTTVPNSESR